jgi:radical SAM superfamily enzyme YgiQ (UPF0313 family)
VADVLLGQAYHLRFDPKLWAARRPYPPLGALHAAAVLRSAGYEVALHDSMLARSEGEWGRSLDHHRPAVAALYEDSFNYLSKMCLGRMREAALRMIAMARQRGCTVVVAGSDATDDPGPYLAAGADHVVVGEAEVTLRELLDALLGRSPTAIREIDGVCFREHGRLVRTRPRAPLKDLDALPLPAWDLVDVPAYRAIWNERHGFHSMNLATTRGCPYHCNWCAKPIYGQRYAVRSPESVAREIAWLRAEYAPDHLAFMDDIFGLRPGWVEAFAAEVSAQGPPLPFKCLSRADLLDDGVVRALARAGCRTVWLGAESGSQKVLDAMEKGLGVEQIRSATRRLKAAGMEVGFFLQFGYPGETRDDVEKTLDLVRECRPDDIGVSVSYPLPGTRFYERVRRQLGEKRHWNDSSDLTLMYRGPFPDAFYRTLYRVVHKELRLRRAEAGGGDGPAAAAPLRARLRRRLALAYHAVTLPVERRRLERLALAPHHALPALTPGLPPELASRPTQQA